jgi:parallel beta-helix repeat protein
MIGNEITHNSYGIRFDYSSNNSIFENNIADNPSYGMYVTGGSFNDICGNNLTSSECSIFLYEAYNYTVSRNIVALNHYYGITLLHSSYTSIFGNEITSNNYGGSDGYGIRILWVSGYNDIVGNNLTSNNYGIYLEDRSNFNTISRNNISSNVEYGIMFNSCYVNNVSENNISNSNDGIRLLSSQTNRFCRNSFVGNDRMVYFDYPDRTNVWDNGFDGNYWSDYNGTDSNGDGIGDIPYLVDSYNQDNYPLMSSYLYADVNHDAVVNMRDIGLCCNTFGSQSSDPNWNPHCDLNEDGMINMRDIGIACSNFGKHYP